MITLTPEEQDLILKNKDLFDQGKMDEFWHEIEYAAPHVYSITTHISQFLRQYFTDEQLIETYVPAYFFYFDKNPVWFDRVTDCHWKKSYNPRSVIPQSVDLSNYKGDCILPLFQHFVVNNVITFPLYKIPAVDILLNDIWKTNCKITTIITDDNIFVTGNYAPGHPYITFDFSKVTDHNKLTMLFDNINYNVFDKSNYCIFPDLPTVYLPITKSWYNTILESDEIEFGKNTVDIKFPNVRSDIIKVKKFIVHTQEAYKIIEDVIKYEYLNSTIELV